MSVLKKPVQSKQPLPFQFIVLCLLTFAASSCFIIGIIYTDAIVVLKRSDSTLKSSENKYDYNALSKRVSDVRASGTKNQVEYFTVTQADINILKFADELSRRYGAVTKENSLLHSQGYSSLKMEITSMPKTSSDFLNMIRYLVSVRNPMVYIMNVGFTAPGAGGVYNLTLNLDLIHPYKE